MTDGELLAAVEREVSGWPGVSAERMEGGRSGDGRFRVPPAMVFRFGRRHIGHVHDTGVADIIFPKKVHDALVAEGRARPHAAGFEGVVSYRIRGPGDVPEVVELFRMGYERAKASADRRREGRAEAGGVAS
jgi:hypothetical protein